MVGCTCLPRSHDDQCPRHGREAYRRETTLGTREEWLSECCSAPPLGEGLPAGDFPAGTCGQCRENVGFERSEE